MSSIRAYTGAVGAGAYSATKGALEIKPTRHGRLLLSDQHLRPSNIKFGHPSIPDYAEFNKLYQAGVSALYSTQQGDPRKAADRIVDMVRSEGRTAGKSIPTRFPVGADAVEKIRGSCSKKMEICDEWEAFSSDTKFDPQE
ncbi:hypothetical protein HO133_000116 [Letharia lupina]|uniref:Uncharacterized protein n=1 Tax=Letharia lupina TaxID=560253 RepID=A0A8H6CGV8_9LECA|nr:uncharacterized protein HO133_000116 [Letharia lupina]KAF6223274.1 hypothetical protein HO133_000116 [Letharia lupina]